jgi:hypothetical protein
MLGLAHITEKNESDKNRGRRRGGEQEKIEVAGLQVEEARTEIDDGQGEQAAKGKAAYEVIKSVRI